MGDLNSRLPFRPTGRIPCLRQILMPLLQQDSHLISSMQWLGLVGGATNIWETPPRRDSPYI